MLNRRIEFIISAKDLTSKALTGVRGGLAKLKSTVLSLKGLAVGAGLTLGIKQALSTFGTFESALVDMGRVTGEAFGAIKNRIMALPEALGSATELMKGYYQVISAGVKGVKDQMDTLVVASKTAKAAHIEQAEVIKGVTKFLAGYEGQVRSAAEAADLLFTIEKEGMTSVADLIPYIGGLAKISNTLNVSQYELGGALATVSHTAGSTADAVTQYEAVLSGLIKPSEQMIAFLRSLGYETGEQAIKAMGFVGVLRALQEATGGSSVALGELFGRKEAIKGFLALASEGFSTLEEKIAAMPEGIGAMDKAWKDYKNSLNGLWDTFKNTVVAMVIKTVDKHAPEIKASLKSVTVAVKETEDEIVDFATRGGKFLLELAKAGVIGAGMLMDSWQGLKMLWKILGIAFRELEYQVFKGLERLSAGAVWFMEKFNIGGVFDGVLGKAKGFHQEMDMMAQVIGEEWIQLSDELRAMADEGILPNTRRMKELIDSIDKAAAHLDIFAEKASETPVPDVAAPDLGGDGGTSKLVKDTDEDLQRLRDMWAEYYLSEGQRLDLWYAEKYEKFKGNQEALTLLAEIHAAKRAEIEKESATSITSVISKWMEDIPPLTEQIGELITNTFENVASGIGYAVSQSIIYGENLGTAFKESFKGIAASIIHNLIKIGVQRLITSALFKTISATEHVARMTQLSAQTYASAFAATAAIPIVGPALAPGVAAASTAAMMAGSVAASATGTTLGIATSGQAHGGLEAVPEDATYVLKRGERVLAPEQNRDLTEYLERRDDKGGDSDRPLVVNLHLDGTRFARVVAPSIRQAAQDGIDFGFMMV